MTEGSIGDGDRRGRESEGEGSRDKQDNGEAEMTWDRQTERSEETARRRLFQEQSHG